MSAPKFTPGPWPGGKEVHLRTVELESIGITLMLSSARTDEAKANAHLIAAAPELYAVVAEAFEREYNPFEPDNQSERYHRWGALLAKARGEG
jgi:hypothetical protein